MRERQRLYTELIRMCLYSRQDRFEFYRAARNYYLFGSLDESGAPYNKIEATVDTLVSFLYAADNVRFVLNVGSTATDNDEYMAVPLAEEMGQQWRMSDTHQLFRRSLVWSLVFGSMIVRVGWQKGVARTWLVEPHQFGVLREDIPRLEDQEAYCLCYAITRTELEQRLEGDPRRDSIMLRLGTHTGEGTPNFGDGMTRLLLSNPVAGVQGSVAYQSGPVGGPGGVTEGGLPGGASQYNYAPRVAVDLVDMRELYVWDNEERDFRIVTIAAPDVVIYDRPQGKIGMIAGRPNFAKVWVEDKLYDYFWGTSYVAKLARLQDWRTEDVYNVRNLQAKQSDPPIAGSGMGGITSEKLAALRYAGGRAAFPDSQGVKVDVLAPKLPEQPFQTINEIDSMFNDSSGISNVMHGKGESGVRSRGQTDVLAKLGSARVKATAVTTEECAEDVASLMFANVQEHSDVRLKAEIPGKEGEGLQFTPAQFTVDYELKVDAHSSSPIFAEDHKADAEKMLELHVIDRETFLDIVNPPNKQLLKKRLKVIEAREAEAAKAKMALEAGKHGGGRPAEG